VKRAQLEREPRGYSTAARNCRLPCYPKTVPGIPVLTPVILTLVIWRRGDCRQLADSQTRRHRQEKYSGNRVLCQRPWQDSKCVGTTGDESLFIRHRSRDTCHYSAQSQTSSRKLVLAEPLQWTLPYSSSHPPPICTDGPAALLTGAFRNVTLTKTRNLI